jgi:hypothetical protein
MDHEMKHIRNQVDRRSKHFFFRFSCIKHTHEAQLVNGKWRLVSCRPSFPFVTDQYVCASLLFWLVLLVLGITLANEPFEGLFAITLLHGLDTMIDRWFMSNPTE